MDKGSVAICIYMSLFNGDTLREIADRYYCELESLLTLNPQIASADLNMVADVHIKLPAPLLHVRKIHNDTGFRPPDSSGPPLDQWIPLTSIENGPDRL